MFENIKKNRKLAYLRPSLPFYDMKNIQHLWRGLAAGCHSKKFSITSLFWGIECDNNADAIMNFCTLQTCHFQTDKSGFNYFTLFENI